MVWTKSFNLPIFTHNSWFYILWSPVIVNFSFFCPCFPLFASFAFTPLQRIRTAIIIENTFVYRACRIPDVGMAWRCLLRLATGLHCSISVSWSCRLRACILYWSEDASSLHRDLDKQIIPPNKYQVGMI